jgi:ubiquinone/menaquinone biosynthesis C-methylase UbiE
VDRYKHWTSFYTKIIDIERTIGFPIRTIINKRIVNFSEKKPFKVLDLGCGGGVALGQLKTQFGAKIKTVGLVLEKTPGEKYKHVDRLLLDMQTK